MAKTHHVYIIAGEASGDVLGGKLMEALQARSSAPLDIQGVGGELMKKQGLSSLFPMSDLSLMGLTEIIPHIPKLRRRIEEVVDDIIRKKPDIVITIDSPGFNFRVAKKLQGCGIPLMHYVAPSVWAYKPERAHKVASLYDHLLLLLPFEQPYFESLDIESHFVGHPMVEDVYDSKAGKAFRKKHNISNETLLLGVLPGSRQTEIKRLLPVFTESINRFVSQQSRPVTVVVPVVEWLAEKIKPYMDAHCQAPLIFVHDQVERKAAYAALDLALAKSGTGALELSLAKVPLVVAYKVNPLSYFLMKRVMRVPYVNLVNITQDAFCVPEFIQGRCRASYISSALDNLVKKNEVRNEQIQKAEEVFHLWGKNVTPLPSEKAADLVLQLVTKENEK